MKTVLVLSVVITFTLAAIDWAAIKAKYQNIENSWEVHAQNGMEVLKTDEDPALLIPAEHIVKAFLATAKEYFANNVYNAIDNQTLTVQDAEEIRDTLTTLAGQVHTDFSPIFDKLKPETQTKLNELHFVSKELRIKQIKEVMALLNAQK